MPATSTATNVKPAARPARARRCGRARTSLARGRGRAARSGPPARGGAPGSRQSPGPARPLRAARPGRAWRGRPGEVRDAGGQARGSRLVGVGESERAGQLAHVRLGQAGVGERPEHPVLGGRPGAGPVGPTRVVGVLAVRDGSEPVRGRDVVGDPREELVLAVEAAVGSVGPVGRVVALVRRDLDDRRADVGGDVVGAATLVGRQAGGDADDGDDPGRSERAHREGEQEAGVDATREGDAEPAGSGRHTSAEVAPRHGPRGAGGAGGGRRCAASGTSSLGPGVIGPVSSICVDAVGHGAATSLRSPDHSVWKAPARSVRP